MPDVFPRPVPPNVTSDNTIHIHIPAYAMYLLAAVVLVLLKLVLFPKKQKVCNPDRFTTKKDVIREMVKIGAAENCKLVVGIDFTKSNLWTGMDTFGGESLHRIAGPDKEENPYEKVLSLMIAALGRFTSGTIPCFGFGDVKTRHHSCFSFYDGRHCDDLPDVKKRYRELAVTTELSGNTNFAPVINATIKIVNEAPEPYYTILVIIADGQVTEEKETIKAIVDACKKPISIVCIGVGDGPWEKMREFDDGLPQRAFDNFQFVSLQEILDRCKSDPGLKLEEEFALSVFMEIPDQYADIKKLGLLDRPKQKRV
jgi:E3 ubiquitin-protein ligase RGLG